MRNLKEEFVSLLKSTNRDGVDYVIEDLEKLGFFSAPASSKFHLNHECGLLEHSLNVCNMALDLREVAVKHNDDLRNRLSRESVIIASLLHDVCKADIYKPVMKRKKNEMGLYEDVPGYDLDYSNFPMGHGEKSVMMLLLSGLEMSDDEMLAIRWHMNAWDMPFQSADIKGNYNKAKEICPLLSLIQAADGLASNLLETTDND